MTKKLLLSLFLIVYQSYITIAVCWKPVDVSFAIQTNDRESREGWYRQLRRKCPCYRQKG